MVEELHEVVLCVFGDAFAVEGHCGGNGGEVDGQEDVFLQLAGGMVPEHLGVLLDSPEDFDIGLAIG